MIFNIRSLHNVPLTIIADTFNAAFSDYVIPINLNTEILVSKIQSENIQLNNSAGVFDAEKLVAFILIGLDSYDAKLVAYNAGTGVVPAYRGMRLTQKMYEYLFPLLTREGVASHQLEVITTNERALTVYKEIGFVIRRKLCCFKGVVLSCKVNKDVSIETVNTSSSINEVYFDSTPSYQNQISSITRDFSNHVFLLARIHSQLAGFLIYLPATGRIKLFGVDRECRRKGVGTSLFSFVQKTLPGKELSVINVDVADTGSMAFLQSVGLLHTVQQFEMELS